MHIYTLRLRLVHTLNALWSIVNRNCLKVGARGFFRSIGIHCSPRSILFLLIFAQFSFIVTLFHSRSLVLDTLLFVVVTTAHVNRYYL